MYMVVFLLAGGAGCQTSNEIYIVRHAEKAAEPANDPVLTTEGKQRAETLKELLKNKNIKAVFSTQRVRTSETAAPISRLISVPVQYYGSDTLSQFLQNIILSKRNTLIVGHSNTSVTMVKSLQLPHVVTFIAEDDYDNMFIIEVKNGKAVRIIETTYGAVSPAVK